MQAQTTDKTPKRLRILGDDEIEALYGRPRFTDDERLEYFSLSATEKAILEQLHSTTSRIYCILQLGYFKARHRFFVFNLQEVTEDARYIQEQYFPGFQCTDFDITKVTRLRQQRFILDLYHYRLCGAQKRQQLETKAQQAARVDSKPVYVFRALIHYLATHRLVSPAYSVMQDTVGKALTCEQNRLTALLHHYLGPSETRALKVLLEDAPGLYEITRLKREPRDFSAREMAREIGRGHQIHELYELTKKLLPHLDISNENIRYYASLVTYYSVFRLKQLDEGIVHLYLLCFVYHRYQKLHDTLLTGLIHHVRRFTDAAKSEAKERVYEHRTEGNENLQKAGHVLKLFTDDHIAESTPFQDVRAQAFAILERQKIDVVADHLTTEARFDETALQWEHIDALTHQFKRHLRPILLAVDVAASPGHTPLIDAVHFLKGTFGKGRSLGQSPSQAMPLRFVPDTARRYLYAQDRNGHRRLLPDRYEFLVYRLLRNGLEAGDIFCRDSVRFRSFEDDLVDDQRWQEKRKLITNTGLAILNQPIRDHLAGLEERLEARLAEVNQRIASGDNEHFESTRRGRQVRWTLRYPRSSEPVNHPIFDVLKQVDIGSVLHFVNRHCHFMEAFKHVLGRYAKQDADDHTMIACLIAWASNMGLGRMGENSDIGYHSLSTTSDNFIRLETLKGANDRVSNAIAAMPIFRHYDIDGVLHSSSDGQRFETRTPTINARYSPKYFGLKKGIVAYTLLANHVPINAEIIGANEHESHYVLDILFNNTTDIQPNVHSTDTHGTNAVNFVILSVFGYQFAPRYRDIYDTVRTSLYGFKHPRQYDDDMLLKPVRKLLPNLIIDEWENIQRIMVSLALKTTTQHIIVGKLSAYARKNKTRRALWEYDNIMRSLYLLDYIDSPPLRRNVQRALNRSESYHQLRRAVSYANYGKLRFKTEYDQQLWEECSRLVTNCIIYYNATILSSLLSHKERIGDSQGTALLNQVSPVAWQHINLHGRYEFRKSPEAIDIDAIVQELSQLPITQDMDD
jgi:TnpA family transposase